MTERFENIVTTFHLEGTEVRGRAVHLDDALDKAIVAGRYPDAVAKLLGEIMMISALVAQALKFKGRLIIQCHGTNEGAVSLLMADCTTDGHIRGYARWDEDQLKMALLDSRNPGAETLLGGGTFSMTIDQGSDMDQYQGLAAIEGASLAQSAEHYFAQSEQIPTRIHLSCGQMQLPGEEPKWRGGGILIQRVAGDKARGETGENWHTAKALFDTLTDEELIDPEVTQSDLLYRLFHETGVRVIETSEVEARCACSEERLRTTLKSFDVAALEEMADDGIVEASCEFCATDYKFDLSKL
ncbi:MAG: Hsp33 family molecular chaperone HslO [Alphaproteobacteria bacterium]